MKSLVHIQLSHKDYLFRRIKDSEIQLMFEMILSRMRWMDEVGIEQWNKTEYDKVYPINFFKEHSDNGRVFVLEHLPSRAITAAAVFKDEDDHWETPKEKWVDYSYPDSALYLHNFVSDLSHPGVGKIFMMLAQKHLSQNGIKFFRLDSAVGNDKLEKYYSDMGFTPAGVCVDGLYTGVLRQKKLQ